MFRSRPATNPVRGVFYIYGSLIFALIFGLISSSMTARLMPVRELGHYRFIISCVSVIVSACTLGLFSSAGTLLAGPGNSTFRRLVAGGASTQVWLVAAATSVLVGILVFTSQPPTASNRWLVAVILAGAMAWPLLLQEILRAKGDFVGLGLLNAAPPALFILLLGLLTLLGVPADSSLCIILFFTSQGLVVFALAMSSNFNPRPHRLGYAYLFKRNLSLGLNVYWGTFLAALTSQSGIFILQFLRALEDVAVFSLALTLTAPLALLPSAVGTAYFSQLPGAIGFPERVLRYAWTSSFFIAGIFVLIIPLAVHFLYGDRFSSVTLPAQICGIGAILQGMGDVYNRYYLANRDTAFLLKTAGIVFASAVILGVPAGLFFGVMGVAFSKMACSAVYALFLVFHYHVAQRRFAN